MKNNFIISYTKYYAKLLWNARILSKIQGKLWKKAERYLNLKLGHYLHLMNIKQWGEIVHTARAWSWFVGITKGEVDYMHTKIYTLMHIFLIFQNGRVLQKKYDIVSTHLWPIFSFYNPWKHQKTKGLLVFSGSIK